MVKLEQVSVTYPNGVQALKDVTVTIESGQFVFLVGPTGSGKSTFLKLLYREEVPTSGRVLVDGTDVASLRRREVSALRRRVGVVFQDFRLLPDRSAYDNIAFALDVTGTPKRLVHRRVSEVIEQVGLAGKEKALPDQLSGGEQQRVSIARAIVRRPSLLLADEPTGNLDPVTSQEIMDLLESVSSDGTTVLVATHDQAIVDRMRRRVISLSAGRIVSDVMHGQYISEAT
ncbi:MAG: cell division ATP-binding protein FtsE [Armatimonadota bacterium]